MSWPTSVLRIQIIPEVWLVRDGRPILSVANHTISDDRPFVSADLGGNAQVQVSTGTALINNTSALLMQEELPTYPSDIAHRSN